MNVHKVELCIVDFDEVGAEDIRTTIENANYPNDCISPRVMSIDTRDAGEWYDEHPLNRNDTALVEYVRLFSQPDAKKPSPQLRDPVYNYFEVEAYLQKKYDFVLRDFAGKFNTVHLPGDLPDSEVPYQDFWHFIVDNTGLHNDSEFHMSEDWGDGAEEWQKTILGYFMDEFGTGEPGERTIKFHVTW